MILHFTSSHALLGAVFGHSIPFWNYVLASLMLLLPLVLFALVIHACERTIQQRLSSRFGWGSVLWTGWLGTPIHESSHALMCWLFRHRIDEISFFEPDRQSGRLGYVRHSYRKGNWFEELGNLFIAIAPLLGGSLALVLLLTVFYPDAANAALGEVVVNGPADIGPVEKLSSQAIELARRVLALENWSTARFWIFLYLVLCVSSHMAPSRSDYQGIGRGAWVAAAILVACIGLFSLLGVDADAAVDVVATLLTPLMGVLGLALMLCGLLTVVVIAVTSFIPIRR